MMTKSKTSSSFWVRNQNFTTSFQDLETLHQFTIVFVLTDPIFTVSLIRIHYLKLFVVMPWPLHCK